MDSDEKRAASAVQIASSRDDVKSVGANASRVLLVSPSRSFDGAYSLVLPSNFYPPESFVNLLYRVGAILSAFGALTVRIIATPLCLPALSSLRWSLTTKICPASVWPFWTLTISAATFSLRYRNRTRTRVCALCSRPVPVLCIMDSDPFSEPEVAQNAVAILDEEAQQKRGRSRSQNTQKTPIITAGHTETDKGHKL